MYLLIFFVKFLYPKIVKYVLKHCVKFLMYKKLIDIKQFNNTKNKTECKVLILNQIFIIFSLFSVLFQ